MSEVYVGHGWEYVEARVLDVPHWGHLGNGTDEGEALAALTGWEFERLAEHLAHHGEVCPPLDEVRALSDAEYQRWILAPASSEEVARTLQLFEWARSDLVAMLESATDDELDWDDANRTLPDEAWWRTARQMAYHIAITASRYYLRMLGADPPAGWAREGLVWEKWPPVLAAVEQSTEHVLKVLVSAPPDLVRKHDDGSVWSLRLCLWHLASHERRENNVVAELLANAREFHRESTR